MEGWLEEKRLGGHTENRLGTYEAAREIRQRYGWESGSSPSSILGWVIHDLVLHMKPSSLWLWDLSIPFLEIIGIIWTSCIEVNLTSVALSSCTVAGTGHAIVPRHGRHNGNGGRRPPDGLVYSTTGQMP